MSILDKLNESQKIAAQKIDGPILILAGAGSGKTRTITHRIAYMIKEREIDPSSILALTFTNKAAREMKERTQKLTGMEDEITVTTFHSFALQILKIYAEQLGYRNNFTIYDTSSQVKVIKTAIKNLSIEIEKPKELLNTISKLKEKEETVEKLKSKSFSSRITPEIISIYEEYDNILKAYNAMDFADLLVNLKKLLEDKKILDLLQSRYKYIMVDEYQDTNQIQYEIVKKLASKHRNICVVGDENQSIYMFRGADISNILNFHRDYKDAIIIKLEENYRSTQNILSAANSVIKNNVSDTGKKLYSNKGEGNKIQILAFDNVYNETGYVAEKIYNLTKKGEKYKDFTILYRINAQSRQIEEKLRNYRLPYKIFGGTSFYDRKEIKTLIAYLTLLNNLDDDISFLSVINEPRRGIGSKTLDVITDIALKNKTSKYKALKTIDFKGKIKNQVETFINLFESMTKIKNKKDNSIAKFIDMIMDVIDVDNLSSDERTEKNDHIQELKRSIVEYEKEEKEPTLDGYLSNIALYTTTDSLNEDNNYVKLMTVHSSKGLEFKKVFIIGMEEKTFPLIREQGLDNKFTDLQLEEERRLCYVAITRAEEELYITYSNKASGYQKDNDGKYEFQNLVKTRSRFIDEIDKNLVVFKLNNGLEKEVKKEKNKSVVENFNPFKKHLEVLNSKFKVGDRVRHAKYDIGIIVSIDPKVTTVEFSTDKKLISTQLAERVLKKV